MSTTKEATATDPNAATPEQVAAISELTDRAIEGEIKKLDRMIAGRQEDVAELRHEICELESKRGNLIQARIQRWQAKLPAEQ